MKHLPTITVVCITGINYGPSIIAMKKTLEQIQPYETLYFSDVEYVDEQIKWIPIPPMRSVQEYSHFVFKHLGDFIKTDYVLVIQHDGYVLSGEAWRDEFLDYDYIGAPWMYTDGRNVGNGGFSLRSRKLHLVLQSEEFEYTSPEDEKICRYYRQTLEQKYGIRYAPDQVAHAFSYELHRPVQPTFGFHNHFHKPYREPIVLKRSGAMGDIIMLEPVMEYLHNHGYRVILDTQPQYFNLFATHHYPVELLSVVQQREHTETYRVINLDMSYETEPKQLALKAYYKYCGIQDGEPKNARLNFIIPKEGKLFDRYVVLHTDDTAMSHRNIHGVDWEEVANYIQVFLGYPVFRVGVGNGRGGQKINTIQEKALAYVIGGADYFIGIDSGCAQIAVACQVKSMIFFGSVNPSFRYDRFEGIDVMQKPCPAQKDGCYHEVVSVRGQDCEVDVQRPPCIRWSTMEVVERVKKFIQ